MWAWSEPSRNPTGTFLKSGDGGFLVKVTIDQRLSRGRSCELLHITNMLLEMGTTICISVFYGYHSYNLQ